MSLGGRLREERDRVGLTQPALGELVGAAKRTVIDWEKGISSPTAIQLEAMAQRGVDVQYVVTSVRSRDALSAEEVVLIERYRAAPAGVRAAAIGALIAGATAKEKPTRNEMVFHGSVGGVTKVQGDLHQRDVKISMGKKKK